MSNINSWGNMDAKSPSTPEDHLKRSLNTIENILKYQDDFSAAFGRSNDRLQNAFRIVKEHLLSMMRDEKVQIDNSQLRIVYESIDILTECYVNGEIPKIVIDFTREYIQLCHNWNNNGVKDTQLEHKLVLLNRLFANKLTMDDTISILQILIKKAKKYAESEPPGYSLSKHFLSSLDEINKKKDDKCVNP